MDYDQQLAKLKATYGESKIQAAQDTITKAIHDAANHGTWKESPDEAAARHTREPQPLQGDATHKLVGTGVDVTNQSLSVKDMAHRPYPQ